MNLKSETMLLVLVLLVVLQVSFGGYSVFDCRGQNRWEVRIKDNREMRDAYQNWVAVHQNNCNNPVGFIKISKFNFGYGSGINLSALDILRSMELGGGYRPLTPWLWSFTNDTGTCYSKVDAIDCFNMPLSYCLLNENSNLKYGFYGEKPLNQTAAELFLPGPADICTQARVAKKPLLWVYGNVIHYHMRLPPTTNRLVTRKVQSILYQNSPQVDPVSNKVCVSAGLHIRAGEPDFGRSPLNGQEHLNSLHEFNRNLAPQNKTICTVYVSCDHFEQTIFASYVRGKFKNSNLNAPPVVVRNGSFLFKFLPHFAAEHGEIEYQVGEIRKSKDITMETLYLEFVADLQILSRVDIFVGSWSNIFIATDALRNLYRPELSQSSTCFIQSMYGNKPLVCRGSPDVLKIWRDLFGGFNGGSMYFE